MKKLLLVLVALIACSAPVGAQDAAPPPHGRALADVEYIELVHASTSALAASPIIAGCGSGVTAQPDVCARQIVKLADALALEVRRSENWPK